MTYFYQHQITTMFLQKIKPQQRHSSCIAQATAQLSKDLAKMLMAHPHSSFYTLGAAYPDPHCKTHVLTKQKTKNPNQKKTFKKK